MLKKKIKSKYKYIGLWLDILDLIALIYISLFIFTKDVGLILPFIAGFIPVSFICFSLQYLESKGE